MMIPRRTTTTAFKDPPFTPEQKAVLAAKVKEWATSRFIRPPLPRESLHINPIHLIPKGDPRNPRGWRIIVNSSYPEGASVNDMIPGIFKTCSLPTFAEIGKWIYDLGSDGFVGAVDFKDAWKQVAVALTDQSFNAWCFDGDIWVETRMPFGWSQAVKVFTWLDAAIEHICMQQLDASLKRHLVRGKAFYPYIDDFIFGATNRYACFRIMEILNRVLAELNIKVKHAKTQFPSQSPVLLGFKYDIARKAITVPADKREAVAQLLAPFLKPSCRSIKRKQLERIVGKLNHLANAWWQGRSLLRSSYNLLRDSPVRHRWVHLSAEVKIDWQVIYEMLGREIWVPLELVLRDVPLSTIDLELTTDASMRGFGATWSQHWLAGRWPQSMRSFDIQVLETWALILAFASWEKSFDLHGKRLLLRIDNTSLVLSLLKRSSRQPTVQALIKWLISKLSSYECIWKPVYIPSRENVFADLLSRGRFTAFQSTAFAQNLAIDSCSTSVIVPFALRSLYNPSS